MVQGLLPNGRDWDPYDVLANVLGSLLAIGVAGWFHRRSTERRRAAKYSALATAEVDEEIELGVGAGSHDLESGLGPQVNGIIAERTDSLGAPKKSVAEELDDWDEHAEDEDAWSDDGVVKGETGVTPATSSRGSEEVAKKVAVD